MKDILVGKALGRYDGMKEMLRWASDEMMYSYGATDKEIEEINKWVERMSKRIQRSLEQEIEEINKYSE